MCEQLVLYLLSDTPEVRVYGEFWPKNKLCTKRYFPILQK